MPGKPRKLASCDTWAGLEEERAQREQSFRVEANIIHRFVVEADAGLVEYARRAQVLADLSVQQREEPAELRLERQAGRSRRRRKDSAADARAELPDLIRRDVVGRVGRILVEVGRRLSARLLLTLLEECNPDARNDRVAYVAFVSAHGGIGWAGESEGL